LIIHRVSSTGTHWSRGVGAFTPVRLSIVVSCTGLQGSCPLPCFPPMVLSSRRLPFLLRVPASPVPRSQRYYEGATTSHLRINGHLLVRFHRPRGPPVFVFRCCAPGRSEGSSGPGPWFRRPPTFRLARAWTQMGPLRSSGDPSCASAPFHDPGRIDVSSPFRSPRCCPRYPYGEGFGNG
jgi:hypothetical protein